MITRVQGVCANALKWRFLKHPSEWFQRVSQNSSSRTHAVGFSIWRRIYSRLSGYWAAVILALVLVSMAAATQPALAFIMKPLLDEGFSGTQPHYVWTLPLAFIGLIFARG